MGVRITCTKKSQSLRATNVPEVAMDCGEPLESDKENQQPGEDEEEEWLKFLNSTRE